MILSGFPLRLISLSSNVAPRTTAFRFFLDEDLEDCYTRSSCLTYENGEISSHSRFEIDVMEVGRICYKFALENDRGSIHTV